MDDRDLKQIEKLFGQGFAGIWEHNLAPAFDAVNGSIDKLEVRMGGLEARMGELEHEMAALNAKVTNYLELSDKRYLELKRKNLVLAKWIKELAEKTGVKLDFKELEEF